MSTLLQKEKTEHIKRIVQRIADCFLSLDYFSKPISVLVPNDISLEEILSATINHLQTARFNLTADNLHTLHSNIRDSLHHLLRNKIGLSVVSKNDTHTEYDIYSLSKFSYLYKLMVQLPDEYYEERNKLDYHPYLDEEVLLRNMYLKNQALKIASTIVPAEKIIHYTDGVGFTYDNNFICCDKYGYQILFERNDTSFLKFLCYSPFTIKNIVPEGFIFHFAGIV